MRSERKGMDEEDDDDDNDDEDDDDNEDDGANNEASIQSVPVHLLIRLPLTHHDRRLRTLTEHVPFSRHSPHTRTHVAAT